MLTGKLWSLERSGISYDWLNFARAFCHLFVTFAKDLERGGLIPRREKVHVALNFGEGLSQSSCIQTYVSFMLANKAQKQQHHIASSFHLFATRFRNPSDEILLTMAGFFRTSNRIIETRRTNQNTRNTVSDYKAEQNLQINTVYIF